MRTNSLLSGQNVWYASPFVSTYPVRASAEWKWQAEGREVVRPNFTVQYPDTAFVATLFVAKFLRDELLRDSLGDCV